MNVVENDHLIFFDVDDTLVSWGKVATPQDRIVHIITPRGTVESLVVNEHIIRRMEIHAIQNHHVVLWSQGGWEWALSVVNALNLQHLVSQVMTKPKWYADDLPADEWMKRVVP